MVGYMHLKFLYIPHSSMYDSSFPCHPHKNLELSGFDFGYCSRFNIIPHEFIRLNFSDY